MRWTIGVLENAVWLNEHRADFSTEHEQYL